MDKNEQMRQQNTQTKAFEALLKEKLTEQYNRGFQAGLATASKIVLEKLRNSSKPLMKRIIEVKQFCLVPFKKKHAEVATEQTEKPVENDTIETPDESKISENLNVVENAEKSEGDNTENKSK